MPSFLASVAAVEIVPRNTLRKSLILLNEDNTDSIYIKREQGGGNTVSATDHDYVLLPSSVVSLNTLTDGTQFIQGRWTCIASANTPRMAWFETEDVVR